MVGSVAAVVEGGGASAVPVVGALGFLNMDLSLAFKLLSASGAEASVAS